MKLLSFHQVSILPKKSFVYSRNLVDLECIYTLPISQQIIKGIPIFASNMKTTGTIEMGNTLSKHKLFTCLSKDITQYQYNPFIIHTFGLREKSNDIYNFIDTYNPNIICLDVANGYLHSFHKRIQELRYLYPKLGIIAGNVCTKEGVQLLSKYGADIIKIGIGNGKTCRTKYETGIGLPQLTTILECAKEAKKTNSLLMSDGGIEYTGDIAKAFIAGAHFIMMGNYFAGTEPCFQRHQIFGMSSQYALDILSQNNTYRNTEGITLQTTEKNIEPLLKQLKGSLASTCTYIGHEHLQNIIGQHKYFIFH
jgi:IMP dehydrogenase/GMP reductase